MQRPNLVIKKGAILAYRLYDVAQEIDLPLAQGLLEQIKVSNKDEVRRYSLKKDPHRTIIFRSPPLTIASVPTEIKLEVEGQEKTFKLHLEVKVWDYGVLSFSYRLNLPADLRWKELVRLGSILDSDSVIDKLACRRRDEIVEQIAPALKKPFVHTLFEDYTTYLIEEMEEQTETKTETGKQMVVKKFSNPIEVVKKASVAELLLAEPDRTLAEVTRKAVQSMYSQYTKKDLLILDWNSALVIDFSKEEEYPDYVDVIEFSLAQLLELRIYDQLLDEQLDQIYDSMENKDYLKITDFYSRMSSESSRMYMEFSDIFEKLDNSIKTIGDFYLAKVLRNADKKFGFEELKKSMSRKIDALAKTNQLFQDKVDSLVEEKRNQDNERHVRASHIMEIIIIVLIAIEVFPFLWTNRELIGSYLTFLVP